MATVLDAYHFAASAHRGQTRRTGEPYITHPVAVARILADLHLDQPSVVAALLHDTMEDTGTARAQIEERFGGQVGHLVDGVSKLEQIRFQSKAEQQAESLRKMLFAVTDDIRVIVVKLADRLHNMRTLGALKPEKRRRIARETLEIYAPMANRLGINTVREELEDLGFRHLSPYRYEVIARHLDKRTSKRTQLVRSVAGDLKKALKSSGLAAAVTWRVKSPYSVYQKMRKKSRSLRDITDVIGFRVVVDTVDDCYRALGVLHQTYKPVPGNFKDYIALPKENGYQSLHTTLFGPKSEPLEIQVRTGDMEKVAESGVASHWLYKTGEGSDLGSESKAREWLKGLMELQQRSDSEEFLESVKLDLFPDKVLVFTPRGDIKRLPRGSSAVDFAYAVHTDVGNRCAAVKVDRRLVPLRTELQSGQTVEVITSRNAKPNASWLNFVVTAKARTGIRMFLRDMKRGEAINLGRRLLEAALVDIDLSLRRVPEDRMIEVLEELELDDRDTLFEQIGIGGQLAPLVASRLAVAGSDEGLSDGVPVAVANARRGTLAIHGTEGLVVEYARCCFPIPDDPILGYVSAGRGVVVHRECCRRVAGYRRDPQKWIPLQWETESGVTFAVEIQVEAANRTGVLAKVATRIADYGSNIEKVAVVQQEGQNSSLVFLLHVTDRRQLARVMRGVHAMSEVLKVTRSCEKAAREQRLGDTPEMP
ncbi:MAG: bifunctional (p)ppGpp synthetase/guanosine-3',5'-bis(diphosphate) 3'-pyrophosphohydrolase [Pseudomonadota bacterium]